MATTSWGGKDGNGNSISFNAEQPNAGGPLTPHFVLEIAGTPIAGAVPVQDTAAEAALATIAAGFATAANQEAALTSLTTIANNSSSGQGAAGISQPAGGTGVQGWLSGCFQTLGAILAKLNGTLTTTTASVSITPAAPSGSLTLANAATSQVLAASAPHGGLILNPASATQQGIGTAESVFINFAGGAASDSAGGQSFELLPGQSFPLPAGLTTEITWSAATAGHKITAAVW